MSQMRGRRAFLGMSMATAGAVTLAACGGNGDRNGSSGDGSAGEVAGSNLILSTISGNTPVFEQYAEAYMAEYPDRAVEVRGLTDDAAAYAQQLATARLGDQMPDLFFNVDFLSDTLAENNVSLDLTPGLEGGKAGLSVDMFLPQFLGQYRPIANPELITGLPVSADSTALYYNKNIFDEYGVDYPTDSWSWEDMIAAGEQIQSQSDGQAWGLVSPLGDGGNMAVIGPVLTAFGATLYDPDTNRCGIGQPEAIDAWNMLTGIYGTAGPEFTTDVQDPRNDFASGAVAMAINSRPAVAGLKESLTDDWDVATVPTVNGQATNGGGSYGFSISQTSQQQDAAWEFLGWFYDLEQGMKLAQEIGGVVPSTAEGVEEGVWSEVPPPPENLQAFGEAALEAVLMAQLPGSASSVLQESCRTAAQEVLLNGAAVASAFAAAEDSVNQVLESEEA